MTEQILGIICIIILSLIMLISLFALILSIVITCSEDPVISVYKKKLKELTKEDKK